MISVTDDSLWFRNERGYERDHVILTATRYTSSMVGYVAARSWASSIGFLV